MGSPNYTLLPLLAHASQEPHARWLLPLGETYAVLAAALILAFLCRFLQAFGFSPCAFYPLPLTFFLHLWRVNEVLGGRGLEGLGQVWSLQFSDLWVCLVGCRCVWGLRCSEMEGGMVLEGSFGKAWERTGILSRIPLVSRSPRDKSLRHSPHDVGRSGRLLSALGSLQYAWVDQAISFHALLLVTMWCMGDA